MPRLVMTLLPVLLGCSRVLAPGEDALPPANLPVVFAEAPLETEFAVVAQVGSVVVQDGTTTGVCHDRENRGAYLDGAVVTLWIGHTGGEGPCILLAKLGAYRATISNLRPGTYTVRVQYIGEISTRTDPPHLERQVTVR